MSPWTTQVDVQCIAVSLRRELGIWIFGDEVPECTVLPSKVSVGISVLVGLYLEGI